MASIAQHLASRPRGFDALRLFLAAAIVAFHSITITHGDAETVPSWLMAGFRLVLPAFFATSGFLVAASLARARNSLEFLGLRLIRLGPALIIVVIATMVVVGPLMTPLETRAYFASASTYAYLSNLWGVPAFGLPGLFEANPRPGIVNGSLWTIPLETKFYLLLAAAGTAGLLRSALPAALLLACGIALALCGGASNTIGLALAFLSGVLLFLLAPRLPLQEGTGLCALLLAWLLAAQAEALAGIPLAYACVWLGCRKPPRLPGDYSYGLYLTAYPLQQSVLALFPGAAWWQTFAAALIAGLMLAALLWHLVEEPVLARKHRLLAAWRIALRPIVLKR
jgi:peptidoglycan/LPS O-acetylase OafA/YrhL